MRGKKRKRSIRSTRIPTSQKLVKVLEEQKDPALFGMIRDAREGLYDDYKSTVNAPIVLLVSHLKEHGYEELAQRAIDGEFDSALWESKEWFEKEGKYLLMGDISGS